MNDWTDTNRMSVMALAEECRNWKATTFARDKTIATLQERIRELEAELATERKAAEYGRMRLGPNLRKMVDDQQARAEKAEKHAQDMLVNISERDKAYRALNARHGECQARVAELERMEEHWHNRALLLQRGEPLAAIERGEREEC